MADWTGKLHPDGDEFTADLPGGRARVVTKPVPDSTRWAVRLFATRVGSSVEEEFLMRPESTFDGPLTAETWGKAAAEEWLK